MTMPAVLLPAWAFSELQIWGPASPYITTQRARRHFTLSVAIPSLTVRSNCYLPSLSSSSVFLWVHTITWKSPSTPFFSSLPHPTQPTLSPLPLMSIGNSPSSHPLHGHHPIPAPSSPTWTSSVPSNLLSPTCANSLFSPKKPPEGDSEHLNQVSSLYLQLSRAPTSLQVKT